MDLGDNNNNKTLMVSCISERCQATNKPGISQLTTRTKSIHLQADYDQPALAGHFAPTTEHFAPITELFAPTTELFAPTTELFAQMTELFASMTNEDYRR